MPTVYVETEHQTADPKTFEVQTEPEALSIGVAGAERRGETRPDLNGFRLANPANGMVFLVDRGYIRHIPNPPTYNNLFRSWDGIIVDINVVDIPRAPSITDGALLAKAVGHGPVYLVDRGQKRHVASPAVMDKYHFSWDRINNVPLILLDSMPDGPQIS